MVRLCSKSSRPYSGRPVARARRLKRRTRRPAMTIVREQESAEGIVTRLVSREGLNCRRCVQRRPRDRPTLPLMLAQTLGIA